MQTTADMYLALVAFHNVLYIAKAETKALHVMSVARMASIKPVEYIFLRIGRHAYAIVFYLHGKLRAYIISSDSYNQLACIPVFDGIVNKIVQHVFELAPVCAHPGIKRIELSYHLCRYPFQL